MSPVRDDTERPTRYFVSLALILVPIIVILIIPAITMGLNQLPYALVMCISVLIPILGCGLPLRGRPLFQSHYHGTPFIKEVMDISEDERIA
jgi:hypothetical protein